MIFTMLSTLVAALLGTVSYYFATTLIEAHRRKETGLTGEPFIENELEDNRQFFGYLFSAVTMILLVRLTLQLISPLGLNDYYSILIDMAIIVFGVTGLILTWTDFELKILHTKVIYTGGIAAIALLIGAAAVSGHWELLIPMAISAVVYFLFYGLIWYLQPNGFGLGDVRLSFFVGAILGFLSPASAIVGFVVPWFLIFGVVIIGSAFGMINSKTHIALGPWIILGSLIGIFWGPTIVESIRL